MNLLLVDDEFHVRKKLMQKIDWKALGIDRLLEAGDGEQISVCQGWMELKWLPK